MDKYNIESHFVGPAMGVGQLRAAFHSIDSPSYDLCHVYGGPIIHAPVASLNTLFHGIPVVCRFNGYTNPDNKIKHRTARFIERQLLDYSHAAVFNSSHQMKRILSDHTIRERNHYQVIPPGVNKAYFHPANSTEIEEIRTQYSLNDQQPVLGACLTPRPIKRVDLMIDLIAQLHHQFDDVSLVVVGDSPHVPKYKQYAEDVGVADQIYWIGKRPLNELYKWYSLFDVTIMTSEMESFGMSLSESYLCRTPCVAFDSGGMSDQIRHGETGFLATSGNSEKLAEYTTKLLTNPQLSNRFSRAGHSFVSERFGLDIAAEKYSELVADVTT